MSEEFYVKHGEGMNHVRKLFFKQHYDIFEEEKIREMEAAIKAENIKLPDEYSRVRYLKLVSGTNDEVRVLWGFRDQEVHRTPQEAFGVERRPQLSEPHSTSD